LLLKSAFERIFNVMQLILVKIKWHIKWKYLIKIFHDIGLSYYFKTLPQHPWLFILSSRGHDRQSSDQHFSSRGHDRQSSEQNNRKLISLHNNGEDDKHAHGFAESESIFFLQLFICDTHRFFFFFHQLNTCCQIFCDLLLKSAFERIFNVMQLILVKIKWQIKWKYLIQKFHSHY
jgi:hypothetical protein